MAGGPARVLFVLPTARADAVNFRLARREKAILRTLDGLPYDITVIRQIELTPIAVVRSHIGEPVDDVWGSVTSRIDLDRSQFTPDCLRGLADFSHVEVVFLFHLVRASEITTGARHPRGRIDWPKVGIFAKRGNNRPNRIGVTICACSRLKICLLK